MDKISAFLSKYVDLNETILIQLYICPTKLFFGSFFSLTEIIPLIPYLSLSQFFSLDTSEYFISIFNDHIKILDKNISLVEEYYFSDEV